MRSAAVGVVAVALASCADDICIHRVSRYYDEALSRQLTLNGVRHSLLPEKGICVAPDKKPQLDAASRQVDSYFNEVAALVADQCEERALVAWATREGLRFEVADTTSSTGAPGRMFLVRSFGPDEVQLNHKKLREVSPTIAKCPK